MKAIINLSFFVLHLFSAAQVCAQEIKAIRPPLEFPFNYLFFIIILALCLVAFICFWIWKVLRRGSGRSSTMEATPRKPWEIAFEQLNILKSLNLPSQGRIKEFYSRLADILRRYMADRFAIQAPEMTTEEFLNFMQKDNDILSSQQKESLKEFLLRCDLVKFAKYSSGTEEIDKSFLVAKRIVDETKILEEVESGGL